MSAPLAWQNQAACAGLPTEWFFVEDKGAAGQQQAKRAKAVCAGCPVAMACGVWAMTTGTDDGIFGGLTPRQRIQIRGNTPGGQRRAA